MRKLGTITFFAASALVVSAGFVRGGMPAAVPAAMSPASTVDTIQLAREAEPRDDRLDLRRADDVFLAFRSVRLDDRGGHGAAEPGDDRGGHGSDD